MEHLLILIIFFLTVIIGLKVGLKIIELIWVYAFWILALLIIILVGSS